MLFSCTFIKCIMKCIHLIKKEQYFDFRSIVVNCVNNSVNQSKLLFSPCWNSDMATRKQHCKLILLRHFTSEQSFYFAKLTLWAPGNSLPGGFFLRTYFFEDVWISKVGFDWPTLAKTKQKRISKQTVSYL